MVAHRESQQRQIANLRDEIQEKESFIAELKEWVTVFIAKIYIIFFKYGQTLATKEADYIIKNLIAQFAYVKKKIELPPLTWLKYDNQAPVVQSTISANLGLPIKLLFWFYLFWLKNLVQISQLKTFKYAPEICWRKFQLFSTAWSESYPQIFR